MYNFKKGDYVYIEGQDYYGFVIDCVDKWFVIQMENTNKSYLHAGEYLELIRSVEEIEREFPLPLSPELVEEKPNLLTPYEMRDGEVGIVRKWAFDKKDYVGKIVQRYKDELILIGHPAENRNANMFSDRNHYQIQLLKKGDIIKIN